jgi:hypothetical protein
VADEDREAAQGGEIADPPEAADAAGRRVAQGALEQADQGAGGQGAAASSDRERSEREGTEYVICDDVTEQIVGEREPGIIEALQAAMRQGARVLVAHPTATIPAGSASTARRAGVDRLYPEDRAKPDDPDRIVGAVPVRSFAFQRFPVRSQTRRVAGDMLDASEDRGAEGAADASQGG